MPTAKDGPHPVLADYSPSVFQHACGAFGRTHVYVKVIQSSKKAYITGRKDLPTMNVFSTCNFNFDFISIFADVKGLSHDSRVLSMAKLQGPLARHKPLVLRT
ncbi:hypothetical protein I350_07775 [Cryptococcus amylolentus CBS 6273]|uniref:DDE Tnp4 domain-containing protein n=1 Tax=Cryptococcus amylolentus CBS 6273 TaxID=1296118 RepID=A0A1E3JBB3_9TREE|nr:hypothetical protein I350_07775 [Cryptococcus amylolentus CBS 6273]